MSTTGGSRKGWFRMKQRENASETRQEILRFAENLSDAERLIFLDWIEKLPRLESEPEPIPDSRA